MNRHKRCIETFISNIYTFFNPTIEPTQALYWNGVTPIYVNPFSVDWTDTSVVLKRNSCFFILFSKNALNRHKRCIETHSSKKYLFLFRILNRHKRCIETDILLKSYLVIYILNRHKRCIETEIFKNEIKGWKKLNRHKRCIET